MGAMRRVNADVGQKLSYFLATGNLVSKTGLDLQQVCYCCQWCDGSSGIDKYIL